MPVWENWKKHYFLKNPFRNLENCRNFGKIGFFRDFRVFPGFSGFPGFWDFGKKCQKTWKNGQKSDFFPGSEKGPSGRIVRGRTSTVARESNGNTHLLKGRQGQIFTFFFRFFRVFSEKSGKFPKFPKIRVFRDFAQILLFWDFSDFQGNFPFTPNLGFRGFASRFLGGVDFPFWEPGRLFSDKGESESDRGLAVRSRIRTRSRNSRDQHFLWVDSDRCPTRN